MERFDDTQFSALLEREGASLASYVLALLGDRHAVEDIVQTTLLELWRIRATFRPGTDFGAWARTVARYRALRHLKQARRGKVIFSSAAVDRIAEAYATSSPAQRPGDESARAAALDSCLEKLSAEQRAILRRNYTDSVPLKTIAFETDRSEGGIKMLLVRLRRKLAECVQARISLEAHADE